MAYEPETYWDKVAARLAARKKNGLIAGDDSPFYRYKRNKFLKLLKRIDFGGKVVLELGPGPGGNLKEVKKLNPRELHGADVSDAMLDIAKKTVADKEVRLQKVQGNKLPYTNNYFDISYTSTVLQHNTDEQMLQTVIKEICRITKRDIYIFERIEKKVKGTKLCLGRPINYYEQLFYHEGFILKQSTFLNIQFSYSLCGLIRKLFNSSSKEEGEKESWLSEKLQWMVLPFTSLLDDIFKIRRDLAMLHFMRRDINS